VFTAVARNGAGLGAGLRWTAVTIDNGDDAKDALDRITIPQDVLDRIAPTALPRSSIIVSDEPLSSETNYRSVSRRRGKFSHANGQRLGSRHGRERTPDNVRPKPTSYGEKAKPSVCMPGGFAVRGSRNKRATVLRIRDIFNACKAKSPAKPQWLKVQSSHSFSQAGRRYTGRQRQRLADGFRQQARK
jgi:hypothetical protein